MTGIIGVILIIEGTLSKTVYKLKRVDPFLTINGHRCDLGRVTFHFHIFHFFQILSFEYDDFTSTSNAKNVLSLTVNAIS